MPSRIDQIQKKLARAQKLLVEVEQLLGGIDAPAATASRAKTEESPRATEHPTGVFDGQFMITPEGKKYQVPPNYASKSRLVVGDRLELVRGSTGEKSTEQNYVKPVQKVARVEKEGILTKQNFQWAVVTDEATYFVLPAAVEYYRGEIGDRVKLLLPADYQERGNVEWAALDKVFKEKEDQEKKEPREAETGRANQAGPDALRGEVVLSPQESRSEEPESASALPEAKPSLAVEDLR